MMKKVGFILLFLCRNFFDDLLTNFLMEFFDKVSGEFFYEFFYEFLTNSLKNPKSLCTFYQLLCRASGESERDMPRKI